jgi:DivIVA domain-containing protein
MRCLECGAETADAQFCVLCGASVIHQLSLAADPAAQVSLSSDASAGHWPPRPAPDSEVGGTVLAEWVEARKFSTVRLRPGYDREEVDVFLTAIRDSFLGVRRPSLTPDEIRNKQFSTTRLRPGYDEEEVDVFLDEAELRLAAQGSDLDTGKAQDGEPELDADSLPVQDQPTTSRTYLIATAGLIGGLVSIGLAATEIAEYAHHNPVGNLAILGMIIGALAGAAALAVNDEKPPGWAHRINTVAALLAAIGGFTLLIFYGGQHGWTGG